MNLRDAIDEVGIDLDNDPSSVPRVRDARARLINRHQVQLLGQYPWTFLETETTLSIPGNFAPTGSGAASFTNGQFEVTTSGAITVVAAWAGQTLIGPDSAEYEIAAVNTSTSRIYLVTAYAGVTALNNQSWSIRYDRVFMPADCANVLGFTDRDRNWIRLVTLARRTEELVNLDRTNTGDALIMVQDDWFIDRSPDYAPTLAQSGTAGSLTANTTYQWCYTFLFRGLESAPSPVAELAVTGTSAAVSGLEDTRSAALSTGRYKYIYRRDKTRNGRWQRLSKTFTETDGATGTLTDTNSGDFALTQTELFESPPVQTYRAWMRPSQNGTAQTIYCRYQRRVRRLYADTDVFQCPAEFHHLFVYMAEVDLFMQSGATDRANARRVDAERLLGRMKEMYLATPDEAHARQSWAGRYRGWRAPVTVTSDFSG